MSVTKKKVKVPRPTAVIQVDWDKVSKYLQAGCSGVECASIIGIHENTLYERCKKDLKLDFVAFKAKNRATGEGGLRAKQYQLAMSGDRVLLIWLGKQRLGQADKQEIKHFTIDKAIEFYQKFRGIMPGMDDDRLVQILVSTGYYDEAALRKGIAGLEVQEVEAVQ